LGVGFGCSRPIADAVGSELVLVSKDRRDPICR